MDFYQIMQCKFNKNVNDEPRKIKWCISPLFYNGENRNSTYQVKKARSEQGTTKN